MEEPFDHRQHVTLDITAPNALIAWNCLPLLAQAMIVDLMHACDVAESLAADPPSSTSDWPWSKQLRFYSDVRMESAQLTMKLETRV